MADLNGDGYNEIIQLSTLGADYNMWGAYNDPNNPGVFTSARIEIVSTANAYTVAVDDLNNDGLLDIVGAGGGDDRWLRNTGNGPDGRADFISAVLPNTAGFAGNTVIADLDKDGFKDVLIADIEVNTVSCFTNRLKILHNLGDPPDVSFAEDPANLPTAIPDGPLAATHDVAVFDIDGDTWPDLVIGTCYGTTVWINQQLFRLEFAYTSGLQRLAAPD